MLYLLLALNIILMSVGQIFFKKSSIFIEDHTYLNIVQKYFYNHWFLSGVFVFGIATFVWVKVLSLTKLSTIYPIQSICYVIVAVLAFFVFGEKITFINSLGILIIILGVLLISQGK
jgi:uncharacterized membrane protein